MVIVDGLVTFPIYCGHVISLSNTDCIAMRIRSSSGGRRPRNHLDQAQLQEHDQQALTAGDLLSDTSSENPDLSENCFSFMRNIRGSAAYWQRAKLDLFAMLDLQLSSSHSVLMI